MIWARSPTNFDSWEAELQFRVTGRGRIGADGLAFWYTATKGFEGPVSSLLKQILRELEDLKCAIQIMLNNILL